MALAHKSVPATLADLENLPDSWRGEIIDDELYAFPRPSFPHMHIKGSVFHDLRGPFEMGRGGPGGWWLVAEPGIWHARSPDFSPDVAGWRKPRMPSPPRKGPITVVPDWICEVLSPKTYSYDLRVKRRFYAEIGVAYLWYIEPVDRLLTVSRLHEGRWMELGVHGPDEKIRAEPFQEVELDLATWWADYPEDDDAETGD